jgi:alpha-N-arabinofuranosidase
MCNIAQMVNVLQSLLLTDGPQGEHCIRTTTYHAFSLFKAHRSKMGVRVESDDSAPLAVSASASKEDGQLVASFVNPRTDADWSIDCELKGVSAKAATGQIIHDSDWNACNTFENPDRIIPRNLAAQVDGGRLRFDLPRMSVATIAVQIS